MQIMTLEQVSARLKDAELVPITYDTRISYNTLKNIRDGKGAQYKTIETLSRYFQGTE